MPLPGHLPGVPSCAAQNKVCPFFLLCACTKKKKKKKERCFPVALQLCVSCCGGEKKKNLSAPRPRDGNSLGNSLGRALKSGGRWDGDWGQAAPVAPGKSACSISKAPTVFLPGAEGKASASGKIPAAPRRKIVLLASHTALLGGDYGLEKAMLPGVPWCGESCGAAVPWHWQTWHVSS